MESEMSAIVEVTEFTIGSRILPDGCTSPDIEGVVKYAIECAGVYTMRHGFKRFTVTVDGDLFETNRVDSLRKYLSSIASGAKCRVFRNYAQGASIMFGLLPQH